MRTSKAEIKIRLLKLSTWLGLLIVIGLFLRMYKLEERIYFYAVEENLAVFGRYLLEHQPLKLVGNYVFPIGIYRTPYFLYIEAFFLWLFQLSPIGPAVVAIFWGLSTLILGFFLVRELFDKKVALVATALAVVSTNQVVFHQRFIENLLNPLGGVVTLYLLVKMIKCARNKISFYWYILVSALSLLFFNDLSTFPLLIFTVICIFIFKIPVTKKQVIFGLLLFLALALPLLLFELRHNFFNLRTFLMNYGTIRIKNQFNFGDQARLFLNWGINHLIPYSERDIALLNSTCYQNMIRRVREFNIPLVVFFSIIYVIPLFFLRSFKKEKSSIMMIYLFFITVTLVVFVYYFAGGFVTEGYFTTVSIFIFAVAALLLTRIFPNFLIFIPIGFLIFINLLSDFNLKNSYGLEIKKEAVAWAISKISTRPFNLESYGDCYALNGYHYLFLMNKLYPVESYMDPYFGWMTTEEERDMRSAEMRVVFLNHEPTGHHVLSRDLSRKDSTTESKSFSHINVLIEKIQR